jgi:hypothetical protein
MEDLSLHILDIAENSIAAQATRIEIRLEEDRRADRLTLEIIDNGKGMDEKMAQSATDPFVTTRTTRRFGLGLPLLAQAAQAANGGLAIDSLPGRGTKVRATFQLSHIDLKPLGDIAQTLVTLILSRPEIDYLYSQTSDGRTFVFDTKELKEELSEIAINSPDVIKIIRHQLKLGLDELRRKT